jgi:uncharacterized protein YegL
MPVLNVSRPLSLPSGVSTNTKQHVLFARDCSGSMSGLKIDELSAATLALQKELGAPINKDGFLLSTVDFNGNATRSAFAQPASTMKLPSIHASGGTNFDAAITELIGTIQEFQNRPNEAGWQYLRPHVLFLSDGQSSMSGHNVRILQEMADVTAIAYGADANIGTLSQISSDGRVHKVGTNGGELRKFLADVGQTLSQSLAQVQ